MLCDFLPKLRTFCAFDPHNEAHLYSRLHGAPRKSQGHLAVTETLGLSLLPDHARFYATGKMRRAMKTTDIERTEQRPDGLGITNAEIDAVIRDERAGMVVLTIIFGAIGAGILVALTVLNLMEVI